MQQSNYIRHLENNSSSRSLIVGITGASSTILGIRLLEALKSIPVESHLVLSESAPLTIQQETKYQANDVLALADATYRTHDIGARIASGSYSTSGMVIITCSIKSILTLANSYSNDLLSRAADVSLKAGSVLILVVCEIPYHSGHLRLMAEAASAGAVISTPVPAFYSHPQSLENIIDNTVGRVLARLGIQKDLYHEWQGESSD